MGIWLFIYFVVESWMIYLQLRLITSNQNFYSWNAGLWMDNLMQSIWDAFWMRKQVTVERTAFYELRVVYEDMVSLNAIANSLRNKQGCNGEWSVVKLLENFLEKQWQLNREIKAFWNSNIVSNIPSLPQVVWQSAWDWIHQVTTWGKT